MLRRPVFSQNAHLLAITCGELPKSSHAGDFLVTNRRRAILYFAEDTSPGIHDTLMAACDVYRYGLLNCADICVYLIGYFFKAPLFQVLEHETNALEFAQMS